MTLSLITQKNYSNILSTYLNVLDTDPAYDMVEGLLADIISAKNASQWLIGDLLVFLRFRTDYQTIKIFNWSGAYSKELVDFIRDEYRVDLDLETKDRQEFLQWEVVKFPKFWLLIEPDEVKVWEYNPSNISDNEFDQYLDDLSLRLKAALGDRSLRAYYRTSRVYPFSQRTPHSWTHHYERTNYIAGKMASNTRGEERLQIIADHVPQTTKEFENNGWDKVSDVREQIRQHNQNERGWDFRTPLPKVLIVANLETGETFDGLQFTSANPDAIKAILASAGVFAYHKGCELRLIDDTLYDSQKRIVATCPHINELVVAEAISYLAEKMEWEVEYESG